MTVTNPSTGAGRDIAALQVARQPAAAGARTAGDAAESDPPADFDRVMARVSARRDASAEPGRDAQRAKKAPGADGEPQDVDAAAADGSAPPTAVVASVGSAAASPPAAVVPATVSPSVEAQPTETPAPASDGTPHARTSAPAASHAVAAAGDALPPGAALAADDSPAAPRVASRTWPSAEPPTPDARTEKPAAEAAVPAPVTREAPAEPIERRLERALGAAHGARADAPAAQSAVAASVALAPTPTYSVAHAKIATPVPHPGFGDELANRVVFLAGQRVHSAELALTPSELGPVSVSIEVRGQEATLVFGASHAATRAALEDALPRLREMFAGSGLQLADAQVGDHARRDFARPQRGAGNSMRGIGGVIVAADLPRATRPAHPDRLIDIVV